ncbi:putative aldehyde dehydrogenase domain protein [Mycobacterium kansasii]|uniref:Putative aldehyde dehydrogenase domain protein n=1 Tax=Mycobacterium kansasii TaxID=1768 RepID=A0A1V3WZS8_MYCKA|nr:putative aldehyde dehydrogenase domain protein [Mycobacterium kansasii]
MWAFIQGVKSHALVLSRLRAGQAPIKAGAVHTRPNGQVVVDVFPVTVYDRLLLNGYKAQVWIEPGVSAEQTRQDAARMYRGAGYDRPGVALVLGAGNVGTITTLDILDQLFAQGNVCVVKMNPSTTTSARSTRRSSMTSSRVAGCALSTAAPTSVATWPIIRRSTPFT